MLPNNNLIGIMQGQDLTFVNGLSGARSYPSGMNCRYALFDDSDEVLYIKETDENAQLKSLKKYRLSEEIILDENVGTSLEQINLSVKNIVSEALAPVLEELDYVKQLIPRQSRSNDQQTYKHGKSNGRRITADSTDGSS